MERRHSRRFNVFFNADLVSERMSYAGFIGNLSEKGVYMRIASASAETNFIPGTTYDVELKLHSEEILNLHCKLVWAYEIAFNNPVGKFAYNIGIEIMEPFPGYMKFYKNLVIECLKNYIKD